MIYLSIAHIMSILLIVSVKMDVIPTNWMYTYKLDVYLQIGDYTRFILIFFYNKVDLSVVILVVEYSVLYQVYFDFLLQPIGCVTKWIS